MTENIRELFKKHDDECLEFDRVKNKRSTRSDISAFILLNHLCPDTGDIVSAAEHDEIFLDVSIDDLAKVASESNIIELIRCGVRYDSHSDCLSMFV